MKKVICGWCSNEFERSERYYELKGNCCSKCIDRMAAIHSWIKKTNSMAKLSIELIMLEKRLLKKWGYTKTDLLEEKNKHKSFKEGVYKTLGLNKKVGNKKSKKKIK